MDYQNSQNMIQKYEALEAQRAFVTRVYAWMFAGLLVTGLIATYTVSNRQLLMTIAGSKNLFLGLIVGELALVMAISWGINRIGATLATLLFLIYAAVNGLTFSVYFLVYTAESIASTFYICSATFGILAVYGHITKTDLTSVGNICIMALIGVIIASIVNMFMRVEAIYWITTYLGLAIFIGLTAYDAQKIKNIGAASAGLGDEQTQKNAILGALTLYLDFINLFLYLLRLFGRRR